MNDDARGYYGPAMDAIQASHASLLTYAPRGTEKYSGYDLSRLLVQQHAIMVDRTKRIWSYNGRHWAEVPELQLGAWALELDHETKPSRTRQNEAVDQAIKSVYQGEISWRQLSPREVPCWNGVVDVDTCEVRPHRKEDYLETVIPHSYDPQPPVLWMRVLNDFFCGDPEGESKIAALQEFFGYILLPHAHYKKALFLWGESDTGKSLVADVIQALVGPENRCTISTEEMADPRKREDIVGKMVNVLSELPTEALIQDAGFKQLVSTGDAIAIDPKYKARYTYVPFCKHVIACNALPEINDHTKATTNRLLLIQFTRVFSEEEKDTRLLETLCATEMPGILAWAVEGAARLVQQGGEFTKIDESRRVIDQYRADANPIVAFLQETTEAIDEAEIPMAEVRERFRKWSGRTYSDRKIGTLVNAAGEKIHFDQRQDAVTGRVKTVRVLVNRQWIGKTWMS